MNLKDEPILEDHNNNESKPVLFKPDLIKSINSLLQDQPFSVLCTQGDCQPYGSLVAFAFTEDMKRLFFSTPKATRKYMLLCKCANVSMVIDSRSQHPDNMKQVSAVTITGKAKEIKIGDEYTRGLKMLKDRHLYMKEFLESTSTALFQVDVVRYFHVTRFQEVAQWIP